MKKLALALVLFALPAQVSAVKGDNTTGIRANISAALSLPGRGLRAGGAAVQAHPYRATLAALAIAAVGAGYYYRDSLCANCPSKKQKQAQPKKA